MKLNHTKEERCQLLLVGNIRKRMAAENIDDAKMAAVLGMAKRTFQDRIMRPDRFTYWELFKVFQLLKITDEEILESFK